MIEFRSFLHRLVFCFMTGKAISSTRYCHPFQADKECPMFAADYVTIEKGTGLVHTAPAHGHDDFKMAMQHKLPVASFIGCTNNNKQ